MARIPIRANGVAESGLKVSIENYNYKYLLVSYAGSRQDTLRVPLCEGIRLELDLENEFGDQMYLYRITNYDALHGDVKEAGKAQSVDPQLQLWRCDAL